MASKLASASRGSVQQGLYATGGVLGFSKLGLAADKRYSLDVMLVRRQTSLFFSAIALGAIACPLLSAPAIMNEPQFWNLIHHAKAVAGANLEARPISLQRELPALLPADIQAFQARYESMLLEANRWGLWGAAHLMNGGCSDDGFKYFRDWLISEGEATFKTALADPDSLAGQGKRE